MAVFAADLGGTNIKLGVVDHGTVLGRQTLAVQKGGLGPQLPEIAKALRTLAPGMDPEGVSFAYPSIMDSDGRVTSDIGKYPDAMGLDLRAWSENEFGAPFAIENDARMAAIGEWKYGAGKGFDDLVMITLGTGIGTGVIIDGKVLRGKHGQAGCMGGHLVHRYDGHACLCGAIGCAEAEASTSVLDRMASEEESFPTSTLKSPLNYQQVVRKAEEGDACASRLLEKSVLVWSSLAVSLVHAYDPELLILGGGVSRTGQWLVDAIQEFLNLHTWTPWGKVRVVRSELGDDAALVAGEWLVTEKCK